MRFPNAETMATGGVDVHFGRHALFLEIEIEIRSGHNMRPVVVGAHEKRWRSILRYRDRAGAESWIDDYREVRPRAHPVDRVSRAVVAGVETGLHERSHFAARREAHKSDTAGIDVPL